MPMTPEQSQQLTNLQKRIFTNAQQGKASTEGITQEELSEALNILRGDRAKALAAGAAKAPKKGRSKKPAMEEGTSGGKSLDDLLAAKGLKSLD